MSCDGYGAWFHYPSAVSAGFSDNGWILKLVISPVVNPTRYLITPGVDDVVCWFSNETAEHVISDWMAGFGPFGMQPFDLAQLAAVLFVDGLTDEGCSECYGTGAGLADDYFVGCSDSMDQCCGEVLGDCGAEPMCPEGYWFDPDQERCRPICGQVLSYCLPDVFPTPPPPPPQCDKTVLDCDGVTPFKETPTPCGHNQVIDRATGCCRPCCCAVNQVHV